MPDLNSRMVGMYMATVRYTMATLLSTAVIWHTHIVPHIRVSCGGTTRSSTGIGFFFGMIVTTGSTTTTIYMIILPRYPVVVVTA